MRPRDVSKGSKKPVKISSLLENLLARWRQQSKQNQGVLTQIWTETVGVNIARHSQPQAVVAGRLEVWVESSSWMNELTYMREKIKIDGIKNFTRYGIRFHDIVFKLDPGIRKSS